MIRGVTKMPENPTLEEAKERLEKLVITAEKGGFTVIASLWLSEAKVILEALKKGDQNESDNSRRS